MNITIHFSVAEFAQHAGHGLPAQNYPSVWIPERLTPLCQQLEVLRAAMGAPIRVLSGFRSEAYNRKIGGARLSQHVQGRAADIVVSGYTAEMVHAVVLELYNGGQLKIGGLGLYPGFVHVDTRPTMRLARWTGSRTA